MAKVNESKENNSRNLSQVSNFSSSHSISYLTLITIALSFIVGVIATIIYFKFTSAKPEIFSTEGLISFILGVVLASASTILAIEAISLGKLSEEAIVKRSDESIKLQNEIFMETMTALERIESSTGVTEKRIEDIIAGRVGAISSRITQNLLKDPSAKNIDSNAITRDIRKTLKEEIFSPTSEEGIVKIEKDIEKRIIDRRNYRKFQQAILINFTKFPGVSIKKMGDGEMNASGEDLVDALFECQDQLIGVSVFDSNVFDSSYTPELKRYLKLITLEMERGTFNIMFIVFGGSLIKDCSLEKDITDFQNKTSALLPSKLHTIFYDSEEAIEKINELLKKDLSESPK